MNALLAEGKLEEMFKQNAEQKQTAMQEVYQEWRAAQTALANEGVRDNENDYQKIIWLLSAILLIVLTVIIASWLAMQRVLLKPLHEVMGHIRHIASGDLTHTITADGRNEMALLAQNVREMQQALANTVSVVRDGLTPSIPGRVKLPLAVTISLHVPSSRLLLWKKLLPAWNNSPRP